MKPIVSFVVPAYNYGRYLADCINSILSLKGEQSFEVVVIDDASTDETPTVLGQFADPRVHVQRHEHNLGHVATVNEAFARTRGEFIARIDADDRYRPDFLAVTLPVFGTRPDVGLVYGDVALIDEMGRVTSQSVRGPHAGSDYIGNHLLDLLQDNFICPASAIARRQAWDIALPIPLGITGDDWYLTLQMARHFEFCHLNTLVADYRVHSSNHHMRVVRERTEEPSMRRMLDQIFSQREDDLRLESAKQGMRRRIYALQYLSLADKYFGSGMDTDARRCYMAVLRYSPSFIGDTGVLRRLAATCVGHSRYETVKSRVKRR